MVKCNTKKIHYIYSFLNTYSPFECLVLKVYKYIALYIFFPFSLTTCCLILWLILFTLLYKCYMRTFFLFFTVFVFLSHGLTKCWFYPRVCLEVLKVMSCYVPFPIECQSLQGERDESWGGGKKTLNSVYFFLLCFNFVC